MASPVIMMEMSADSIFLAITCEDNQIYLHSVATGTFIHTLRGHKSKVGGKIFADGEEREVLTYFCMVGDIDLLS